MPWYKSGTVSVTQNSNAVIGTGTAFIANSRVGDAFRGPDGGWYEVTNIASDTAMAISPNYQGATNAAGTYALAPMQGYVKDSADALRTLVNQYGAKLAALGTTGNYDILPLVKGGTGRSDGRAVFSEISVQVAAALFSTQGMYMGWNAGSAGEGHFVVNKGNGNGGFTWRSVNAGNTATGPTMSYSYDGVLAVPLELQVPKITGLTTALSTAQGGTGNTTGTAAKLAAGAMVGTVSQAGGVPTGAIIESGSNANGWFVKFADGTMICRGVVSASPNINNPSGNLYYYVGSLSFSATFVGIAPQVFPFFNASGYLTWATVKGTSGLSAFEYYLMANAATGVSGILGFVAFGRWY
ncbi:hypothetical protein J2X84_004537 [Pseudomonas corrugata]|uniref:phage tail protein n=1 Tax=Pseudomonas corrugata TaxID=47879 RepID=UPI0028592BBA|nr:phage tail protein [Pseudomonas corrugata]MDR7285687.1 hypothetical protein [Pseudomonas corrugata]